MTTEYRSSERSRGYTLVALVVAITVMNILVAAALQPWGQYMQREREQELIFRGLQYAEAIRVFQIRFGSLPTKLEDLVEREPRCLRQLWSDPMSEDGEWDVILAQQNQRLRGGAGQNQDANLGLGRRRLGDRGRDDERDTGRRESGRRGTRGSRRSQESLGGALGNALTDSLVSGRRKVTTGPIVGVKSKSQEASILVFLEQQQHDLWEFRVDLLTVQAQGQSASGTPPRLNAAWIGRPFRQGISPLQSPLGGAGDSGLQGQALEDAFGNPTDDRGNDRRGSLRDRRRGSNRDESDQ